MVSQLSAATIVRSFVASLLLLNLCSASVASAAEMVSVKLQSGRRFTAEISPRTDAHRLWLRFRAEGVSLLRPIDWDRVVEARYKDQTLSADELRELATELVAHEPLDADVIAPTKTPVTNPATTTNPSPTANALSPSSPPPHLVAAAQVRTVDFYARVANWDNDADADGLLLNVFPQDADGNAVAVSGTLEVDLIGYRIKDFSTASQSRGYVLDRLGHWSQRISANDLQPGGIRVKLPFQTAQPEFNSQLGIYGLVHVRLVVPGQGVFENSQDAVRIRSFAPTRDVLEQQRDRRYFSVERTGRGNG